MKNMTLKQAIAGYFIVSMFFHYLLRLLASFLKGQIPNIALLILVFLIPCLSVFFAWVSIITNKKIITENIEKAKKNFKIWNAVTFLFMFLFTYTEDVFLFIIYVINCTITDVIFNKNMDKVFVKSMNNGLDLDDINQTSIESTVDGNPQNEVKTEISNLIGVLSDENIQNFLNSINYNPTNYVFVMKSISLARELLFNTYEEFFKKRYLIHFDETKITFFELATYDNFRISNDIKYKIVTKNSIVIQDIKKAEYKKWNIKLVLNNGKTLYFREEIVAKDSPLLKHQYEYIDKLKELLNNL